MFNVITDELVTFNHGNLENGDVFQYTPPCCQALHIYNVFKMYDNVFMTVTKLTSERCDVESWSVKKHFMYYLDRYGYVRTYKKGSILDYMINQGELPPEAVCLVTLKELKEELNQENVVPLISKLNDEIKEYSEIEQASAFVKEELTKSLKHGSQLLLKYNYDDRVHSVVLWTKKEDDDEF